MNGCHRHHIGSIVYWSWRLHVYDFTILIEWDGHDMEYGCLQAILTYVNDMLH